MIQAELLSRKKSIGPFIGYQNRHRQHCCSYESLTLSAFSFAFLWLRCFWLWANPLVALVRHRVDSRVGTDRRCHASELGEALHLFELVGKSRIASQIDLIFRRSDSGQSNDLGIVMLCYELVWIFGEIE